ncbi:hypothetical protein HPB51_007558 [Rhipicephalus microplus]|uniref:Carboxylesterase type B domain-containing protein n=1 Tax=Rhipicephalus microplus TaxID=6941 RepID=A0A9J6EYI2_RHIMP|nr:hypothetical protein HPB51_007558 [Rhipicephalus microplus]
MATSKKVINIPKYSGASTDVPFDKWLRLFEVRTAAAEWTERDKLCYFSDYLAEEEGEAMAASVPGITTPQVPAAEDGAPSTIDPSKTRKPKKRKGHRAGSTKEPKGNKQSIMTPMNGNDEERAPGVPTPSVATTPKSTHVLSSSSQSTTPTSLPGESRSDLDRRAPFSDRNADTSASTNGSSIASPVSSAPRASEIRGMNHQQAEQERGPRRGREKDRSKGKPRSELVQPQDKSIATSAVPESFSPSSEEQKSVSSLTQAKPEENDEPQQASLKDATSTSERSKPLMAPPFCYSFVVTAALLFAGANYRIYTFLGIPYAQPPVHNLRFRLPLPYSENSSVVPATLECPPCPQRGWFSPINEGWEGAEECLHLNVWTPCAETTTGGGCAKLPVLLFLFAEGFQTGSNMRFDGSLLAASQNLVVIAPNFRIGVLGFFHKDGHEMPGNLALHDQELVIKWVEDHADLFGGNWNNTVLMGAATGAWSIGAHLVSMNPFWRWRTQRIHSASPSAFADAIGCGQNQSSSICFTNMPLEIVMEAGRLFPFGPYYESRLLPQAPWHMARRFNIIEKQTELLEFLVARAIGQAECRFQSFAEHGVDLSDFSLLSCPPVLVRPVIWAAMMKAPRQQNEVDSGYFQSSSWSHDYPDLVLG